MKVLKVASAVPLIEVANVKFNSIEIEKTMEKASSDNVDLLLTPELSLTASSCGDLFRSNTLITAAKHELIRLSKLTKNSKLSVIVGLPIKINGALYDCCTLISGGSIKGIVPKNIKDEKINYFKSGNILKRGKINIDGNYVLVGQDIIFKINGCSILIETGFFSENFSNISPDIICSAQSCHYTVSTPAYINRKLKEISNNYNRVYLFSSAGIGESTTDSLFYGASAIAKQGKIISKTVQKTFTSKYIVSKINLDKTKNDKIRIKSLTNLRCNKISKTPFIPSTPKQKQKISNEVLTILSLSLAKRLKHTRINHPILGISGGLDSTLALLATVKACDVLNLDRKNIVGITMPGFGTTKKTSSNAVKLMKELNITIKEIDITNSCKVHFNDIGQSENEKNVVYENAQARERTQILLDYANKIGGLVVGTGDLSELALGFCTYAGDHISMYSVNSGVPKTLLREVVKQLSNYYNDPIKETLLDILNTPISPELLPPDKEGNITQRTENILGDYRLHDFYIYYFLKYGYSIKKIKYLANLAFKKEYDEKTIEKSLGLFIKRFFTQQFKRSCSPDGPKVLSISLSPRTDLKMPSDASYSIWEDELTNKD